MGVDKRLNVQALGCKSAKPLKTIQEMLCYILL